MQFYHCYIMSIFIINSGRVLVLKGFLVNLHRVIEDSVEGHT